MIIYNTTNDDETSEAWYPYQGGGRMVETGYQEDNSSTRDSDSKLVDAIKD